MVIFDCACLSKHRRGYSLIEVLVVIAILGVLFGLTLGAVQRARATAARIKCQNHLHQIGVALQNYHQIHGVLPPGHESNNPDHPFPYLSWRGRLLPYLGQGALWQQTEAAYAVMDRSSFPWFDPPHPGMSAVVPVLLCPSDDRITRARLVPTEGPTAFLAGTIAFTSYLGVSGADFRNLNGCLFADSRIRIHDVADGASNTLLVGERPPSYDLGVGWWYASYGWISVSGGGGGGVGDSVLGVEEWVLFGVDGLCNFGSRSSFGPGRFDDKCGAFHYWSPHLGGGANFLFADGSVRFLRYEAAPLMPALATRAGGEAVESPD